MKKNLNQTLGRRMLSLAMVLLMAFPWVSTPAMAASDWSNLQISVSWLDGSGNTQSATAAPLVWNQAGNTFWVQVTNDAPLDGLTLNISHPNHSDYTFAPGNGEVLTNVQNAQGLESNAVYITAFKGDQQVDSYILYVSTNVIPPEPVATQKPPAQKEINVSYKGTDGADLGSTKFTAIEGQENRVQAPTEINGYTLTGDSEYKITVDSDGNANPASVTFNYAPPATPKPPAQTTVDVYYKGTDGASLGSDKVTVTEGQENRIQAPTEINGYTLTGDSEYYINVDGSGNANPASVTFNYAPPATQKPPAQTTVDVYYKGTDGADLGNDKVTVTEGQENRIQAPTEVKGYTLTGDSEYYITVDGSGTANPSSVTFNYAPKQVQKASVPIEYVKDNQVFYTTAKDIPYGGSDNITVDTNQTPAGYKLNSPDSVSVSVDANGNANPNKVTFSYVAKTVQKASVPIEYVKDNQVFYTTAKDIPYGGSDTVKVDTNQTPSGYQLNSPDTVSVSVDANGNANPNKVTFSYVAKTVQKASVPIEYVKDNQVFYTTAKDIPYGGSDTVKVDTNQTPSGYQLNSPDSVSVSVDANGNANPNKVTFSYVAKTVQKASVPIEYVKDNQVFYTTAKDIPYGGSDNITVDTNQTPSGYQLNSPDSVSVSVDANGNANPNKVTFSYVAKTVQKASVPIEYVKDNQVFYTTAKDIPYGGSDNIKVDTNQTPSGYQLNSPDSVSVSVDANGNVSPNKVTFSYVAKTVQKASVPIEYVKDNQVFYTTAKDIPYGGSDNIKVDTNQTPAGYKLNSPDSVSVSVDANGNANPNKVTFSYVTTVVETPVPVGNAIDRWGVINSNNLNFRSSPAITSNNVIKKLSQGTHIWMYESQYNEANEVWTRVNVDGQDGYIKVDYIDMMTQAQSDAYQATLASPMPTRSPAPNVTPTPTPVPNQYTGFALTTKQVALRIDTSNTDQSILGTLPTNTLVHVVNQVYQGTVPWSLVETLDGLTGYVPDDSLRRINQEEAKYYIDQYNAAHPTAAPQTPTPSPTPVQQHGYAATLGDNVPMRGAADPNSMLVNMLAKNTVVYVSGQEYLDGTAWHIVQYKGQWGYIRADQLRWLSQQETDAYLKSLNSPTPTPANTLPPLDQNSASSYGYVTKDGVNFRSAPGGSKIGTLNKYAFALVLGSTQSNGTTWYKVNQAGKEGYISGDFFHVLSLSELENFLQSPEYAQGTTGNTGNNNNNTGNNNGNPPTSPEDLNVGTWTNPNTGLNATYEPFDPYTTPEPIPTPTASPTPEPLATFEPLPTDPPVQTQADSSSFVWLGLGVVLLGGFGGLYAYALHKSNQRKAAARAAQRRAAMQQNPQSGARPYARATNAPMVPPASGTQVRPATPSTGAPKPPTPGSTASPYSQRPANTQPSGMAQRPPVARPGQTGTTPAARPGQQPGAFTRPMTGTQPGSQSTASYRPEAQGNAASETGTSRQPRASRHTGSPTDQNTPTDTNENL